jgi:hypothetical protein
MFGCRWIPKNWWDQYISSPMQSLRSWMYRSPGLYWGLRLYACRTIQSGVDNEELENMGFTLTGYFKTAKGWMGKRFYTGLHVTARERGNMCGRRCLGKHVIDVSYACLIKKSNIFSAIK